MPESLTKTSTGITGGPSGFDGLRIGQRYTGVL
jgi:hypothetical protein